jgi:DNA-binding MarR family transcriptional regulator
VSSVRGQLGYLLKRAFHRLSETTESALAAHEIDGREFAVLMVIEEDGPLSQQDVVRELNVDRTTMVALIDGLEHRGLLERRQDPGDRRRNIVQLTAHGRKTVTAARPAVDDARRQFLAPTSDADAERLVHILRAILTETVA